MSSHSSIIRKVQAGWNRIQTSIRQYLREHGDGCQIRNWPEFEFNHDGDLLHAEMSHPVVLWNWPYRGSSNNSGKKFHIVVNGRFTCRAGTEGEIELLSYGTQIGYFEPKSSSEPRTVIPIDGYHFDMEITTQRAHPVFHAQRDETVLFDELGRVDLTLGGNPPQATLRHVHLPTPQIDLLSALIMLIADHMVCDTETEEGFFQLARRAREFIPLKANLGNQAQLSQCIEHSELLLDHWYAPSAS
ncbi:MAG TPA: hypothetical protein ENJ79_00455 [Gammaproteobacteria bacterium]|nr:hypothetical protein [Gammaproteobacteria bacterium]